MILLDIYSTGLWVTYFLIALAVVGMFAGILISILQNIKKGGLVAIGALVGLIVLFVIGYAMSSNVVPAGLEQFIDSSGYQLSSGGLITFYVLVFIAFLLMILGLLKNIISGN